MDLILAYRLIKTCKRLTFDIVYQAPRVTNKNESEYHKFVARNGVKVTSKENMGIQENGLWLLGKRIDGNRSGSIMFEYNGIRDIVYEKLQDAIDDWASHHNGMAVDLDQKDVFGREYIHYKDGNIKKRYYESLEPLEILKCVVWYKDDMDILIYQSLLTGEFAAWLVDNNKKSKSLLKTTFDYDSLRSMIMQLV